MASSRTPIIFVFAALFFAIDVPAQTEVGGMRVTGDIPSVSTQAGRAPNWGASSEVIQLLLALNFTASRSGTTWDFSQGNLYRTGGSWTSFDANVDLPSGAEITYFEIEGCDDSATAHIQAYLFRGTSPGDVVNLLANVATTDAGITGCTFVGAPVISPNRFVDRLQYRYEARIDINGTDVNTRVGAVRVFYKLRVSPAPGAATFTDVPASHLFFQYIEALAASGITAGCVVSPPQFCPDAPLTRGQMAVFLSRALGLHFPN